MILLLPPSLLMSLRRLVACSFARAPELLPLVSVVHCCFAVGAVVSTGAGAVGAAAPRVATVAADPLRFIAVFEFPPAIIASAVELLASSPLLFELTLQFSLRRRLFLAGDSDLAYLS